MASRKNAQGNQSSSKKPNLSAVNPKNDATGEVKVKEQPLSNFALLRDILVCVSACVFGVGGVLDYLNNSLSTITPRVTYIGTAVCALMVAGAIRCKVSSSKKTAVGSKNPPMFVLLDWKYPQWCLVGVILLSLWIPFWLPAVLGISQNKAEMEPHRSETKAVTISKQPNKFDLDITPSPSETAGDVKDLTLNYEYSRVDSGIHITPSMPYLMAIRNNDEVVGYGWGAETSFYWNYPDLLVQSTNNSPETVFLSEMALKVEQSKINTDPVLVFDSYTDELIIRNEGWGEALNPVIHYDLRPRVDPNPLSTHLTESVVPEGRRFSKDIPTISTANVVFDDFLEDGSIPDQDKLHRPYDLWGDVSYNTISGERRNVRFKTVVNFSPGAELALPDKVYDVFLEAGRANYEKTLPISQYSKPGQPDSFFIRVGTDKSASFDLEVSFRTNGGVEVARKHVRLDIFVPRTDESPRRQRVRPTASTRHLTAGQIYREYKRMPEKQRVNFDDSLQDLQHRKLMRTDVEGKTDWEILLMKNYLFAVHGYTFKNPYWSKIFREAPLDYDPNTKDVALEGVEADNLIVIKKEAARRNLSLTAAIEKPFD